MTRSRRHKMAAPIEILLTSELSGQLWNTCAWDPTPGTALMTYKGSSASPQTLCLLGNEYLINAANNKPLIHIWALQRKDQMQIRIVCPGRVSALAATPDGAYCVAAIAEKIHVWEVSTGNLLAVVGRHYQPITCLGFTDDGSHFLTAGEDNLVLVWSLASVVTGTVNRQGSEGVKPVYTWSKHSLPITDIHIGAGGIRSRVVTASLDHTCKLWELCSGQLLVSFVFDTSIMSVAMDTAECRLFAGGSSGSIFQVNLLDKPVQLERHISNTAEDNHIFKGHSKQVTCLSVSVDGTVLASGSHDASVKLWDISSFQCIKTIPHKGLVTNVLFTPTPPNMFNPDARPRLPLAQFKRSLHVSSQGEPQYEGEQMTGGSVSVRLGKRKLACISAAEVQKTFMQRQNSKDMRAEHKEIQQLEMQQEMSSLRKANKGMYEFVLKDILSQK